MSIQYAGGTRVNTTFTDAGTRASLVSNLNTQLKNAGWSVISGDGTGDVLMKTAVTADGLSCRLRLLDPGSGNCAQFTLKNNAGTKTSQIHYLLPASAGWRIVANKFNFFMFRSGATQRNASRGVLYGGTIWVPSYLVTYLGTDLDVGFIGGNGDSDTTQVNGHWRTTLTYYSQTQWGSSLWLSNMINYGTGNAATPRIITATQGQFSTSWVPTNWDGSDDNRMLIEPLIYWSADTSSSSRPKLKGQLFDAVVMAGQYAGESLLSFDGHSWISITDQADVVSEGWSTLLVAVS